MRSSSAGQASLAGKGKTECWRRDGARMEWVPRPGSSLRREGRHLSPYLTFHPMEVAPVIHVVNPGAPRAELPQGWRQLSGLPRATAASGPYVVRSVGQPRPMSLACPLQPSRGRASEERA